MASKEVKKFLAESKRKGREQKLLRTVAKKPSRTERFGKTISAGFDVARKGLTRTLQEQQYPERFKAKRLTRTGGIKTGSRGRPKGSYDPRYAKYGGVYGYRKALAQRNRLERIQALRQAAVTPRQQVILQQIEARDAQRRLSPESRVTPDTYGDVSLGGIMRDISDASNILQ